MQENVRIFIAFQYERMFIHLFQIIYEVGVEENSDLADNDMSEWIGKCSVYIKYVSDQLCNSTEGF